MNFNNIFAVWLTLVIAVVWVLNGTGAIDVPGEILGALVTSWILVVQYYFRRKPDK